MFVRSFNLLGLTAPEKTPTKMFNAWKLERKKNEEIKRRISSSSVIPVYTIHLPIVHMFTRFQPSMPHNSWEKCEWRKNLMFENWRERKMKTLKGTNKQQQPDSCIHDTSAHCPRVYQVSLSTCVPSFNILGLTFPEKSVTKTFNVWKLERKKNGEIKGQISSSSLFPESCPLSTCVPSFNLLGLTVPEKSVKSTAY